MSKHLNSKRKVVLLFSPILVALLVIGIVFSAKYYKKERDVETQKIVDEGNYTYSQIYLADSSNTLIPLTIKYPTKETQAEELMHIFSSLRKNNEYCNETFNGLLPSECVAKSMTLDNGTLNINFDDSLLSYDAKNEMRIIESLTWTFTDLDYVNTLTLSLNDKLLTNMPVNNTPLPKTLTKQFGINNYLLTSTIISYGERVLSYYEKKIDNDYYYVPVTHYVKNTNNQNIYDLTVSTLLKEPGITSSLEVCRCLKETSVVHNSAIDSNILYVSLSEDILFDEVTVSYDVYKVIKETMTLLTAVDDVSFLMDLEEVRVNQRAENEEKSVSKIELNKYYI